MPSKGDDQFAAKAVARGFLSEKIARLYLENLRELEGQGHRTSVDRLLLSNRLLTAHQVRTVQEELGRRIQFCPSCGRRQNVHGLEPGAPARCTKCKEKYVVEGWAGEPRRPVVSRARADMANPSGSGAASPLATSEMGSMRPNESQEIVFGCPTCGGTLTLEDEFCPRCHPGDATPS